MAYATLIDTEYLDEAGDTIRIQVERDGYTAGTVYSPKVTKESVNHGEPQNEIHAKRASMIARTTFAVNDPTLMQLLRDVPSRPGRIHRVSIDRNAVDQMVGYCVPDATTTPRTDERTGKVSLRAKDRLKGLGADWVDSNGDPFSGVMSLSNMLTSLLNRLGFDLPLNVVMLWRPSSMSLSEDPLSMRVDPNAFYRSAGDNDTRTMEAGEVLDSVLNKLNLQVVQWRGEWWMVQMSAFAQSNTDSNDEVDVWHYDSSGGLLTPQQTKIAGAIDATNEAWETGTSEVSGMERLKEVRNTYNHNAPNSLEFEGSFETIVGWTLDNSTHGLTLERMFDSLGVFEGDAGLHMQAFDNTGTGVANENQAVDYAEHAVGNLFPNSEDMTLVLRDKAIRSGDEPDTSRDYFTLRHEGNSGTTYYWNESTGAWETPVSPIKNEIVPGTNIQIGAFRTTEFTIPPPPDFGTLYLRLWNPVYQDTGSVDSFDVYFDALEFNRSADAPKSTTFRVYDPDAEEGDVHAVESRIGQGPWEGAPGAILDHNGAVAFEWSTPGSSTTYPLEILNGREILRMRSRPQETSQFNFVRPANEPTFVQALDFDGKRYWPISLTRNGRPAHYEVRAAEIVDTLPSSLETQILPGRSDVSTSPSGDETDTTVSWDEIEGKPSTLGGVSVVTVANGETKDLPDPANESAVAVICTAGTGTIQAPSGSIEWEDHSSTSYTLDTHEAVLFTSEDNTAWHGHNEILRRIRGFAVGQPSASFKLMSFVADGVRTLKRVEYVAGVAPSGSPTLAVDVNGTTVQNTTLSGTSAASSMSTSLTDGDVVDVTIDTTDPALRDVKILFRYLVI